MGHGPSSRLSGPRARLVSAPCTAVTERPPCFDKDEIDHDHASSAADEAAAPPLLSVLLVVSCAGEEFTYKLYPGPRRSGADLAIIGFGESASSIRIEGMLVDRGDYGRVELFPGSYTVSILVYRTDQDPVEGVARLDLVAGKRLTIVILVTAVDDGLHGGDV